MVVDVVHQFQPHVVDGGGCFRQQRQRAQQFFRRSTRRTRILVLKVQSNKALVLIRPCIYTYNKKTKIQVRIHSTVKVIRTLHVHRVVLEGTQRVPPTCITKMSTYLLVLVLHRTVVVFEVDGGDLNQSFKHVNLIQQWKTPTNVMARFHPCFLLGRVLEF